MGVIVSAGPAMETQAMKLSPSWSLLGCTALLPVAAMAANPTPANEPAAQVQTPPPGTPESTATTKTGEVTVQQPAPQVHVAQPQPRVTVRQAAPEIIVRQAPPAIAVQMPQPEIIVRMPKPEVSVAAPPPQVSVTENKPQIQVEAAKPNVNVTPQQQAANVQTQEARPTIRYEQTGQPQVFVKSAPGQPQIRYEEMTGSATGPTAAAETTGANAQQIKVAQLTKADVYDEKGNKIGRADHVVQDRSGSMSVVIGHNEALGGKDVMLPLSSTYWSGDRLVIRGVTVDQLKSMPQWTASDQNVKELDANQSVPVSTRA
jgi:hypothetical protein